MPAITIIVTPVVGAPGRYEARLDSGRLLVGSRWPFLAAARQLLEIGYPADTVIEMKRSGSDIISLRSTVGAAAQLTVDEVGDGGPKFARWKPFCRAAVSLPIALDASRGSSPRQ